MKLKHLFMCICAGFTVSAYATPLFQAGNIEEGKKWSINFGSGTASYFADGNSGKVEFSCDLEGGTGLDGDKIKAVLRTGKNFDNEFNLPITPLSEGVNGPFIWTLTDEGQDVGNIKVFYVSGSNVTVQCYGKKL
jgi:hypothetical protein